MSNIATSLGSRTSSLDFAEGQKLAGVYDLRQPMDSDPQQPIWTAFDDVLGRDVSLHFIPAPVRTDQAAMEALRQEVKRNRQLIHPNILRVYDVVEEADWAAISMDAFAGESLATSLRKSVAGMLEPSEIKPWLEQLCKTLQDTHKIQLVHRDLSPRNLFIDSTGKLLITSFGTSRIIKDALGRLLPAMGVEPGISYMSPQQLDGERPGSPDDIYAFGILLHELLVGEPPFTGSDIVAQIRRKAPASLNERRQQKNVAVEMVPAEWEKAVSSCLEKTPEQRPKAIGDIWSALSEASVPQRVVALVGLKQGERREERRLEPPAAESVGGVKKGFDTGSLEGSATSKSDTRKIKPIELLAAKAKLAEEARKAAEEASKPQRPELPARKAAPPKVIAAPSEPSPSTDDVENGALVAAANAIPDHYPSFGPSRSSFPVTWLAAAGILLAIAVYGVFFRNPPLSEVAGASPLGLVEGSGYASELTAVTNAGQREAAADLPVEAPGQPREPAESAPAESALGPASDHLSESLQLAIDAPRVETSSPAGKRSPPTGPPSKNSGESFGVIQDAPIAAKAAALEKAQRAKEAADQASQELKKQQQQAETALAEARRSFEAKSKALEPMMKAAEEVESNRKKREEEMRTAEAEAQKAQEIAAEKMRLADEAKKSLALFESENQEKVTAQKKGEEELKELKKVVEEKQRLAEQTAKGAEEAAARIAEQNASIKKWEQELAAAQMAQTKAAEEAARLAAERRRTIESELEATRRMFKEKMEALEKALQESQSPPIAAPTGTPLKVEPAPAPASQSNVPQTTNPSSQASNATSGEMTLALKTVPPRPTAAATPPRDSKKPGAAGAGFENSLGMRFAPVDDVLFSIWQTRVQDFEAFAKATGLRSNVWKDPGFKQGPTHPVVNVTWMEAVAFCKWLTVKEQKEGLIATHQNYRLPTDLEWSRAVGLEDETGRTPEARDMGVADVYPWGTAWPPPAGAGNYTGEETGSDVAIKGYDDGFAWTSPVGSFPPNKFGLYDMGGNVWQWCQDSWNPGQKAKVLRGGSWYNGALKLSLLSSCRVHAAPDSSTDNYGFRCVIANAESGKPLRR